MHEHDSQPQQLLHVVSVKTTNTFPKCKEAILLLDNDVVNVNIGWRLKNAESKVNCANKCIPPTLKYFKRDYSTLTCLDNWWGLWVSPCTVCSRLVLVECVCKKKKQLLVISKHDVVWSKWSFSSSWTASLLLYLLFFHGPFLFGFLVVPVVCACACSFPLSIP